MGWGLSSVGWLRVEERDGVGEGRLPRDEWVERSRNPELRLRVGACLNELRAEEEGVRLTDVL